MTRAASPACNLLGALGLVGAAACGEDVDENNCAETAVVEFPDLTYGRPEELEPVESDCAPGSLASVDLSGRWAIVGQSSPYNFEFPVVRESCREGIEIDEPTANHHRIIHRDDSTLFWRMASGTDGGGHVVVRRACAIPGSDELSVALATCNVYAGEETCWVDQGRMRRFGRPPGESESSGLALVSEWTGGGQPWPYGWSFDVKVAGGVAFVARFGDLRLVDVSNPASPADLGAVPPDFDRSVDYSDVELFEAAGGTHVVLAGGSSPIVDARDPTRPVIVGRLGEPSRSAFVRTDDMGRPLAYLATPSAGVPIYDLSDPSAPVLVERVPVEVPVNDVHAEEDRLYLNTNPGGFTLMERVEGEWTVRGVLPPTSFAHSNVSSVGEVAGRRIAIAGDQGTGASLHVVDVDADSPAFLTELGSYESRSEVSIGNMMLVGSRAYLTNHQDGVRILDLADPARPELVAYYHTWHIDGHHSAPLVGAIGLDVDVDNQLVYVADADRGLVILGVTR